MYVKKVEILNFRLLENVSLFFDERNTVIVGRNNSGKTSLTELIRRILSDKSPSFRLEDFSLSVHENFLKAFYLHKEKHDEEEIRNIIPFIEVKFTIDYEKNSSDFGLLGKFIIDLNPDCFETVIIFRYQLNDGEIEKFFNGINYETCDFNKKEQRKIFFKTIRERIHNHYSSRIFSIDPNDTTNQKFLDLTNLQILINSGFINAQRGLNDITNKDMGVLGKVFITLFNTASSELADPRDQEVIHKLEEIVESLQESIDTDFKEQLEGLLPAFSLFGYPGLSDPKLCTETQLDVNRLLSEHTRLYYSGVNGINLPESYSGLGVRNLIYILLRILEFFKSFQLKQNIPGIHLVFIEEPEVHLHPQMQEVFIRKIGEIADMFASEFNEDIPWPVQFIVTTHSTHIANEASFESMRYFLATPTQHSDNSFTTRIKDLKIGLGGIAKEDQEFLHKYMTLMRCDLLFADKAVLIEGTTERLLLPKMIEMIDNTYSSSCKLSSQYVSVVEVGGAYAHRFFNLLDFLELPTLIITDLDSVKVSGKQRLVACMVSDGEKTSNGCIKKWFDDINIRPEKLINESETNKIQQMRRLTYQIPEVKNAPCGRSFEEAFILANPELFDLVDTPIENVEEIVYNLAKDVKKTEFALEYALEKTQWTIPRYIKEGLLWLTEVSYNQSLTTSPTELKENQKETSINNI